MGAIRRHFPRILVPPSNSLLVYSRLVFLTPVHNLLILSSVASPRNTDLPQAAGICLLHVKNSRPFGPTFSSSCSLFAFSASSSKSCLLLLYPPPPCVFFLGTSVSLFDRLYLSFYAKSFCRGHSGLLIDELVIHCHSSPDLASG